MKLLQQMKNYKGNKCSECSKPISTGSRSGFCQSCVPRNKLTQLTKDKVSISHRGKLNPAWKGESVSIASLHIWITRNWGRASSYLCACGKPARDWANLNLVYDRNRENWDTKCRSCHMFYDYKKGFR